MKAEGEFWKTRARFAGRSKTAGGDDRLAESPPTVSSPRKASRTPAKSADIPVGDPNPRAGGAKSAGIAVPTQSSKRPVRSAPIDAGPPEGELSPTYPRSLELSRLPSALAQGDVRTNLLYLFAGSACLCLILGRIGEGGMLLSFVGCMYFATRSER